MYNFRCLDKSVFYNYFSGTTDFISSCNLWGAPFENLLMEYVLLLVPGATSSWSFICIFGLHFIVECVRSYCTKLLLSPQYNILLRLQYWWTFSLHYFHPPPHKFVAFITNSLQWQVVNQSGLNLLCHFFDKQSVTVSKRQSASIILR